MTRHRWGDPVRSFERTNRECLNGCGIFRVTRHDGDGRPWVEFWRDESRVDIDGKTPPCDAPPKSVGWIVYDFMHPGEPSEFDKPIWLMRDGNRARLITLRWSLDYRRQFGPLPRKRWLGGPWRKQHHISEAWTKLPMTNDERDRIAIAYAKWLAVRDGIVNAVDVLEWRGVARRRYMKRRDGKGESRIYEVGFGPNIYIEIPNWDFDPETPREELIND
jgi:hypothetical protein